LCKNNGGFGGALNFGVPIKIYIELKICTFNSAIAHRRDS